MLNQAQQQAVRAPAGPLLILAGAGTGKTRTLVHRIGHLIAECGVPPHRILAVTFTNKAAAELNERLNLMMGDDAGGVIAGTFHAIALRFLRRYADHLGFPNGFQIIDADDQRALLKRLLKEKNIDSRKLHYSALLGWIEHCKHAGLLPEDVAADPRQPVPLQPLYEAYQQELKRLERMDFSDLLVYSTRLLRADDDIAEAMRRRFDHVLVDEYQDTNPVQHEWLTLLCRDHRNLTVVGDDDQSIYGWRGANVRHILDFSQQWPDAQQVCLEENYRSGDAILRLANAIITAGSDRHQKQLRATRGEGHKPCFKRCRSEYDEARQAAIALRERHRQGIDWSEMAVLYRSNHQSLPLERVLREEEIPYRISGGLSFFERMEVKDALCFWALLNRCADGMHLLRIANKPKRGIGAKSLEQLRLQWLASGLRVSDWLDVMAAEKTGGAIAKKIRPLAQQLVACRETIDNSGDRGLFAILEAVDYFTALQALGELEYSARRSNLESLRAHIETQLLQGYSPIEILDQAALMQSGEEQTDTEQDAVQLMSLHRAKGLEFDTVVICGVEEGLLPHTRAMDEGEEGLAEERRLLYVGITRARNHLLLLAASTRRTFGETLQPPVSRFIRHLPDDVLARHWQTTDEQQRIIHEAAPLAAIRPGAQVMHPSFGEGTVLHIEGQGEALRAAIQFRSRGLRHLMLKYARLALLPDDAP